MCTILVFHQIHPAYPLVIAANRDEFLHRPATGPLRLDSGPVPIVGGRDEQKGGTWMAATAEGFFAGLTNVRGTLTMPHQKDAFRSRGELVMEVLRLGAHDDARRWLEGLDGRCYRSFQLLFGDAQALWVAYGHQDQASIQIEPVTAGIHVLPNSPLDDPRSTKVARALSLLAPLLDEATRWEQLRPALERILADRTRPSLALAASTTDEPLSLFKKIWIRELEALCVRTPTYGTRSATILALTPGQVQHYLFAQGSPHRAPFEDVTSLLQKAA